MAKVLVAKHAEALGGGPPVEPGQEIPKSADPERVRALEDRGLIKDRGGSKQPSPSKES
jgi:hypothetical protein